MRGRDKFVLGALAGGGLLWGARAWLRHKRRIDLADRVVIVTGASSGHGFLVAQVAAERGARLVIAARRLEALEEAADELRRLGAPEVLPLAVDVTDPRQVEEMVQRTVEHFGRIDVLINNAGIISVGPIETMTLDDFRTAMDTNFWGAVHATLAVVPQMRRQRFGRIGNVVSVGGRRAVPHLLPYTASKFALTGFTQGMRTELARDNILVTGVYPGTMRTGGHRHALFKGDVKREYTWFALSDSLPGLSTSAARVARQLWRGVCDGEPQVIAGWPARLAIALNDLFPDEMDEVLALVNRVLPPPVDPAAPAVRGDWLQGTVPNTLNQAFPARAEPGRA